VVVTVQSFVSVTVDDYGQIDSIHQYTLISIIQRKRVPLVVRSWVSTSSRDLNKSICPEDSLAIYT
jgi:hypothetical protein